MVMAGKNGEAQRGLLPENGSMCYERIWSLGARKGDSRTCDAESDTHRSRLSATPIAARWACHPFR